MLDARNYEPDLRYGAIVPNTNAPGFGAKTINLTGTTPVKLFSGSLNPFNGTITGLTTTNGSLIAQTITLTGENGVIAVIPMYGSVSAVFGTNIVNTGAFTTSGSITAVSSVVGLPRDASLTATFEVA